MIEVDGWSHKKKQHIESDRLRDFNLARLGWKIMRVRHEDIDEDLSAVVIKINEWICSSQSR